jgi:hypothetical protein
MRDLFDEAMPETVWAAGMKPAGLEWRQVELVRTTRTRATLRFKGDTVVVSLDRLFGTGARSSRHRGWTFTGQRHGVIEMILEMVWEARFGGAGMRAGEAAVILGLPDRDGHTEDEIQAAFRRKARETHPDTGGSAEAFQTVTKARAVLLSVLAG